MVTTITGAAVPNGNWTLADDYLLQGNCTHDNPNGGFILSGNTGDTAYYLHLDTNADLHQEDGDVTIRYGSVIIFEPGSSLTFDGSDNTYRLTTQSNGSIIVRGITANHATIGGADASNRAAYLYFMEPNTVNCKCLDLVFTGTTSYAMRFYLNDGMSMYYFEECEFTSGSAYVLYQQYASVYFNNCILGDASTTRLGYIYRGTMVFQDCTIYISTAMTADAIVGAVMVYNDVTWTDYEPTTFVPTNRPLYSQLSMIECRNLTVDEQNNVQDALFVVQHENFPTDEATLTDLDNNNAIVMMQRILNFLSQVKKTNSSGQAVIMVPYRFYYWDEIAETGAWYEISESGGSYSYNGQYELSLIKDGYRIAETTLYGSSDQTWSPTLQAQSDFDDILTGINDIKGTGFVKDTHSLTNILAIVAEILQINENRLEINEATSELWLYNDAGSAVIKKWPITDKDSLPVRLEGTAPANRGNRTL